MDLKDISGRKIGIFGFGVEGESLLRYLTRHGIANITIFDENELSPGKKQAIVGNSAHLVQGKFIRENCSEIEVAFHGPGLKPDRIKEILPKTTRLSTLTNLFFSQKKGKVVAVTGTKGKSTTVGLVSGVLKQNNIKFFTGGNIGNSPLDFVDETTDESFCVLELSSFQLENFEDKPDVAIVLPISSDHLDHHVSQGEFFNYHKDQESYMNAKGMIAKNMEKNDLVIAYNSDSLRDTLAETKAEIIYFGENVTKKGCGLVGHDVACSISDKETRFLNTVLICQASKIPIIDALAAITFSFALGLKLNEKDLLEGYEKLPFRIQLVSESNGMKFYNDSAATNPISTIEATKTMGGEYSLIMGGSSKGLSFRDLAEHLSNDIKLKKIYLIGQTSDEIEKELKSANFKMPIIKKTSLKSVLDDIKSNPKGFNTVLFSPASASFDQFKNYKDRGEIFNRLVRTK